MKVSIIIPACKEAKVNRFIKKLRKIRDINKAEIIMVDCSSKKESIKKINGKNLIKISSKKSRSNQQNKGARIASGDILLFLHSDTILPKNAMTLIKEALKDKKIHAGAFQLRFQTKDLILKLIAYSTSIRSKITRIPYGDQAIFIRKSTFNKLGGFPKVKFLEDVLLMEKLRKDNLKIKILNKEVMTSPRRWEHEGILRRTLRNRIVILGHILGKTPEELSKIY